MSFDYAKTIAAARRLQEGALVPTAPTASLRARVARSGRRRAMRAWSAVALALLVVLAWLASSVANPLVPATCSWVEGADVLRYGVVHVVGFCLGAALVRVRWPWARVLVRAAWWSSLLAASVGAWAQPGTLPVLMPVMACASAVGLWLFECDATSLGEPDFPLRVHRRSFVAMLTLAFADAETLASAALNHDEAGTFGYALLDGAAVVLLAAGIVGLYRVRGWGLVSLLGTNVLVAVAALTGVLIYDPGFAALLATTSMLQLAIGIPVLQSLWRSEVPLRRPWTMPAWAGRMVLVSLVTVGLAGSWWFARPQTLAPVCAEE